MSLYSSWNTFSPRLRSRTYKRDAAGLIVSWLKGKLKKRLWRWRLNVSRGHFSRLDLSFRVKQPSSFIQRRVYLELQINRNLIQRKLVQKSKKPSKINLSVQSKGFKQLVKKGRLTVSQEIEIKRKSIERMKKILKFLIFKRFLAGFYELLFIFRRSLVAREMKRCLTRRVKRKLSGFFKGLKELATVNTFEIFKIFSRKIERKVEKIESVDFSPNENKGPAMLSPKSLANKTNSSSFLEFSTNDNQSKQLNFDLSPIPWGKKTTLFTNENVSRLAIHLQKAIQGRKRSILQEFHFLSKSAKNFHIFQKNLKTFQRYLKVSAFRLIKTRAAGKKLIKSWTKLLKNHQKQVFERVKKSYFLLKNLGKLSKTMTHFTKLIKQKYFFRLLPRKVISRNSNKLTLLAFALKMHITTYLKSIFSEFHRYTREEKILSTEKRTQKLNQVFKVLQTWRQSHKKKIFQKIMKTLKDLEFFTSAVKLCNNNRAAMLKFRTFQQWKGLKRRNMNFCRAFELLGQFLIVKKTETFNLMNLPHPLNFYKSSKYRILSSIVRLMMKKKDFELIKGFIEWKRKRMYIKILRISVIFNKIYVVNLLDSWQAVRHWRVDN
jgi:hypothetical protein